MQELLSEMSNPNWDRLSFDARYEMFDKLLDLEKEQIIDAVDKARNTFGDEFDFSYEFTDGEEYFNQTYNQNK